MPSKLSDFAVVNPTSGSDIIYVERDGIGYQASIKNIAGFTGQDATFENIWVLRTGHINKLLGGDYGTNLASGSFSAVAGGTNCRTSGQRGFIGAGQDNRGANQPNEFIGAGLGNMVSGIAAGVVAGQYNSGMANSAFVGGGHYNFVFSLDAGIAAGFQNYIPDTLSDAAFVGGGQNNLVRGTYATVVAGNTNWLSGTQGFMGAGDRNAASGANVVSVGGLLNVTSGTAAFLGGGAYNVNVANYGVIGGGIFNTGSGDYSTIPGGEGNRTRMPHSVAWGRNSVSSAAGEWVFSDSRNTAKQGQGTDTITFNFQNGVWVSGGIFRTSTSAIVGSGASSDSVDGFCYLPATTGVMVSTPTHHGRHVPVVFDSGNNKVRAYNFAESRWVAFGTGDGTSTSGVSPASQSVGAGTNYTLTDAFAALDFGTTDPSASLDSAGTWLLMGKAVVSGVGANTTDVLLKLGNGTVDIPGSEVQVYMTTPDVREVSMFGITGVTSPTQTIRIYAKSDATVATYPLVVSYATNLVKIKLNNLT